MQCLSFGFLFISEMLLMACTTTLPVDKNMAATVTLQSFVAPGASTAVPKLGTIPITTAPISYHPAMSSTVGIGLTPAYTLGRSPETVKYKWHTNYGHFVSWKAPQFQVIPLGADTTTDATLEGVNVFWSYDPNETGKDKPVVQITLTVMDAQSNATLTTASLTVEWENKDTAKVR